MNKPPYKFDWKNEKHWQRVDAHEILEDVIDTLIEVGNGVTDEMLHEAANKLIQFRDEYFNHSTEMATERD